MRRGSWANDPGPLRNASRHGVIRTVTLTELGVAASTVSRRCARDGPWQRLLPGVVLLGSMAPTRRQFTEAALLYAGAGSVVTGREACWWHGMRNLPPNPAVHVLIPHSRKTHGTDRVIVERTRRMPGPIFRAGLPLAPVGRSVLDACRRLARREPVQALITEAVQRLRVTPEWLLRELAEGSRRGAGLPREVLADVLAGARSVAEIDAMRVWERTGLPRPVWNTPLRNTTGEWIATPDAWFAVGLAWEIDSHEFHFQHDGYANTLRRNARYAMAGVTVLQTLPSRLRGAPDEVAAELVAAYRAAERLR